MGEVPLYYLGVVVEGSRSTSTPPWSGACRRVRTRTSTSGISRYGRRARNPLSLSRLSLSRSLALSARLPNPRPARGQAGHGLGRFRVGRLAAPPPLHGVARVSERGHIHQRLEYQGMRLIDSCITQLKAQGPSRTCNESKEEEEEVRGDYRGTSLIRTCLFLGP